MKHAPVEIVDFLRENHRLTQPSVIEAHGALLLVDPLNDTPYPSASCNRVDFFDVSGDDDAELIRRAHAIRNHYRMRGCSHCFVYVQPTPTVHRVMAALTAAGFARFDVGDKRPTYHTLWRPLDEDLNSKPPPTCPFSIRRLPNEAHVGEIVERFGAFDGETCVGKASLHVIGRHALLTSASTLETHRNRGTQSALIRARLKRALERGCDVAICETLSILSSSLNNLRRAGFEILYDKPVFEWRDSGHVRVTLADAKDAAVFARWRNTAGF